MKTSRSEDRWAEEEFGDAALGNAARTRRLVVVAARAAACPAGRITEVFTDSAAREGAFRFVENAAVSPAAMMEAAHRAGVRRCVGAKFVYIPVDKSTVSVTDWTGRKGLGMVGTEKAPGHGLQVMSAIAVLPDGTPQGLVGQSWWTRVRRKKRKKRILRHLPVAAKETQRWRDVMETVTLGFAQEAPETQPWFQLDREGDAWAVLKWAVEAGGCDVTVRAHYDRCVCAGSGFDGAARYLWAAVGGTAVLGTYDVQIPERPHRQAAWRRSRYAPRPSHWR
jgi:hypothetical protein